MSCHVSYMVPLRNAYTKASKSLVDFLMIDNKLMDYFVTLKSFFLISSGDYFLHFVDAAGDELSKKSQIVNPRRLQALLELAINLSSSSNGT